MPESATAIVKLSSPAVFSKDTATLPLSGVYFIALFRRALSISTKTDSPILIYAGSTLISVLIDIPRFPASCPCNRTVLLIFFTASVTVGEKLSEISGLTIDSILVTVFIASAIRLSAL